MCGKERYVQPSVVRQGRGIYCSKSCSSKNSVKKMLARVKSGEWLEKSRGTMAKLHEYQNSDETHHPRWLGDKAGYYAMHDWITKHYGQPKRCEVCGLSDEDRKYHWANLSSEYRRDIGDWKRMCVPCHRKHDYARKNKRVEITSEPKRFVRI